MCHIESLPWLPPPRLHIVDAAMVPVLELLPPRISSAVGKRLIAANGDVPLLMGGLQRMIRFNETLATAECIGKSLDASLSDVIAAEEGTRHA